VTCGKENYTQGLWNAVGVDAVLVQVLRWEVQGLSSLSGLESEVVQVALEDSIVAIVEQT
jgi:hypothetical protein